jgi:hypothetical protein
MKKIKKVELNKDIKNVKGLFKAIIVTLFKAIALLIKNIMYIGYLLIYNFNNLIAKIFNKLPRLIKVGIVYTLVGLSILNFVAIDKTQATKEIKETTKEVAIVENKEETIEQNELQELEKVEQEVEEENICKLSEIECKIYEEAMNQSLTEEQAYMVLAISKHETGHWKSSLFRNNNNLGGIYNSREKKFYTYETQDKGITAMVSLLKNGYFNKGLDTIEKIGARYCPVGAKNDPKGLNKNWVPNVTKYYNEYFK